MANAAQITADATAQLNNMMYVSQSGSSQSDILQAGLEWKRRQDQWGMMISSSTYTLALHIGGLVILVVYVCVYMSS